MSNSTEESGLGDCMACFSKIENYGLLPDEESQKIVDNCWNYLHENISNSKLQNVQSQIGNELPLCKKCFDAASELCQLSELVIKSEKKISNLSFEFSLGVLARRTNAEGGNNTPDGQISPKEFIVLDVSKVTPGLFSTEPTNPTNVDDFAHPCEDNWLGMDAALNDPQHILEIVQQESEHAVDEESADSEDDTNVIRDEELQAQSGPVVVLKRLKEAKVSKKCNSQQPPLNALSLKHGLRSRTSKKKVVPSSSSKIIQGQNGPANVKPVKSVSSGKVRGSVGTRKKQHKCNECEKVFVHLGRLKEHIRVHTGEKPYKCSFCPKAFAQASSMQVHLRIHTGDKPFKCSFCAKTFAQLNGLQIHERIHTGKYPFKCNFCTKAFCQMPNLQKHVRSHTGEKPYKCSSCGKAFSTSYDKQRHERIHTGETS